MQQEKKPAVQICLRVRTAAGLWCWLSSKGGHMHAPGISTIHAAKEGACMHLATPSFVPACTWLHPALRLHTPGYTQHCACMHLATPS
eukprot:1149633-Pelagomonas_calceolata.AAC.9